MPSPAAIRETIESVVIAFVLAFLFRTFEAEAFVIPTGSMAPTLMGRHKDLDCPKCGCPYQVSASEEVDADGALQGPTSIRPPPAPVRCVATRPIWARQSAAHELPVVQRRPHPGGQVRLRVGRSAAVGRDRVQVSRRRHDRRPNQFHQAVGGSAGRDDPHPARRHVGSPRRGAVPDRAEAAGKAAGHAPAGVRQRLHAARSPSAAGRRAGSPNLPADGSTAGAWSSDDYATFHTDGTAAGETLASLPPSRARRTGSGRPMEDGRDSPPPNSRRS